MMGPVRPHIRWCDAGCEVMRLPVSHVPAPVFSHPSAHIFASPDSGHPSDQCRASSSAIVKDCCLSLYFWRTVFTSSGVTLPARLFQALRI